MTPTERLEAAAVKLDEQAEGLAEDALAFERYGFPNGLRQREARARAMSALLRAVVDYFGGPDPDGSNDVWDAAAVLAGSVGVSDKEAGNE